MYLISYSYRSYIDSGEDINIHFYKNGVRLPETYYNVYYNGGSGKVVSTGGRSLYKRLKPGDTLHLGTDWLNGHMFGIILCVEFINN